MSQCCICKRTMEPPSTVKARQHPEKYVDGLIWFAEMSDSACYSCLMTAAAMTLKDPKKRKVVVNTVIEQAVDMKKSGVSTVGEEQAYLKRHGLLIE